MSNIIINLDNSLNSYSFKENISINNKTANEFDNRISELSKKVYGSNKTPDELIKSWLDRGASKEDTRKVQTMTG